MEQLEQEKQRSSLTRTSDSPLARTHTWNLAVIIHSILDLCNFCGSDVQHAFENLLVCICILKYLDTLKTKVLVLYFKNFSSEAGFRGSTTTSTIIYWCSSVHLDILLPDFTCMSNS